MAAIQKGEVVKTLNLAELQQYEEFEVKINAVLQRDYGSAALTFGMRGMTPRVKELVRKNYEAAGWKVEFHADQHDGDYVCFS